MRRGCRYGLQQDILGLPYAEAGHCGKRGGCPACLAFLWGHERGEAYGLIGAGPGAAAGEGAAGARLDGLRGHVPGWVGEVGIGEGRKGQDGLRKKRKWHKIRVRRGR